MGWEGHFNGYKRRHRRGKTLIALFCFFVVCSFSESAAKHQHRCCGEPAPLGKKVNNSPRISLSLPPPRRGEDFSTKGGHTAHVSSPGFRGRPGGGDGPRLHRIAHLDPSCSSLPRRHLLLQTLKRFVSFGSLNNVVW